MSHKINLKDYDDWAKNVIIAQDPHTGKKIVMNLKFNSRFSYQATGRLFVEDKFGKIVHVSDYLALAQIEYNKLP